MSFWIFWVSVLVIAYTYVGYAVLVRVVATYAGVPPAERDGIFVPAVTVVIAAYNEAAGIAERVQNILDQQYPTASVRIIVVSDGSSDGTERVAAIADNVQVIALARNGGKAVALNAALRVATTEFVVFTDARQRFAPEALRRLVAPFADPAVGAVSGELHIVDKISAQPLAADIGLYWRIEKSLREDEAEVGWLHGVSGAVCAVRRELFRDLPAGTILDDMWIPLQVIRAGRRVWMARDAVAYDMPSKDVAEEFRRKVRTLAGNWQLIALLPWLLVPGRNPVFLAWFSHKFLRLIVPWALLAAWLTSARMGGIYHWFWLMQTLGYLAAGCALMAPAFAARVPLLPASGTFLMLNAAAGLALPAWLRLRRNPQGLWKKH
ncbi:MAG: glycosyltransferase family 2 protein [Rudaea sp.]